MDLYDIPVIQPDLRHEETIIQIANAFNLLQQVIADVFDKVDDRIKLNSKAVQEIDLRIDRINRKIDELSNDYESIDIQSPCDYPPEILLKDIPMTLTISNRQNINLNRQYHIESGPDSNISKTYEKKLQFYYVRQPKSSTSSAGSVSSKEAQTYLESGLGSVPSHIDSINALLLFNKSENVFDKKTQKNLRRIEQSAVRYYDPVLSDGPGDIIEKAPASITTRQLLNMRIRKNLFMATQWNDDEQIDIPIMLPDVSGIRDKKKKKIVKASDEKITEKISEEPKSVPRKSVPPNESETDDDKNQNEINTSSSVVDSAPIPPPVPPPINTNEMTTPKAPPPKLNSNTQDRSSLMEAIRQAGGAQKMKKKDNIEQEDTKEKTEKVCFPLRNLHII